MQQLEIKYFFPLTEQIPLDLDFSPCEDYARQKAGLVTSTVISNWLVTNALTANTNVQLSPTLEFRPDPKSVGYWKITETLHIWRETKPSWLHRKYTEFILGWEWKDK
jgi:hypothetical protein